MIAPAATRILPVLTPLAAIALVVPIAVGAAFHLRLPGETSNVVVNLVLRVIALFVAYGRLVLYRSHRVIAAQVARSDSDATPSSRAATCSEITIAGVGQGGFKSIRPDRPRHDQAGKYVPVVVPLSSLG